MKEKQNQLYQRYLGLLIPISESFDNPTPKTRLSLGNLGNARRIRALGNFTEFVEHNHEALFNLPHTKQISIERDYSFGHRGEWLISTPVGTMNYTPRTA